MSCLQAVRLDPTSLFWYAVRTRSNYEKTVATVLESKGYERYLPLYRVRRRWSDRTVETSVPLFPGYVFCRLNRDVRTPVLSTPGVVSIVHGCGNCFSATRRTFSAAILIAFRNSALVAF